MADAVWPVGLPTAPQVASYSQVDSDRVIRSSMETGPAKVRLRSTAVVQGCNIELKLTRTQVATLLAFHRTTCLGGALPFQWKHHETGNQIDYRFVSVPECRPRAPRQAGGEYWVATFRLETVPGTEVEPSEPPAAPTNRAGGGAGVGGEGSSDADGMCMDCCACGEFEDAVLGFLPFEADSAPPVLLIQLLSGFGSGFDDTACCCCEHSGDPDSDPSLLLTKAFDSSTVITHGPSGLIDGGTSSP